MIAVLRLGHRPFRDKRITTHVALVARSFGADEIYIDTKDVSIEQNIDSINHRFGGKFKVQTDVKPRLLIKSWDGVIVHLTMYGAPLQNSIEALHEKKHQNLLIIVGADKVPAEYYTYADWNISVGNQPHSEVAALALFLDRYTNKSWEHKKIHGSIEIIPSRQGKNVVSHDAEGDELNA